MAKKASKQMTCEDCCCLDAKQVACSLGLLFALLHTIGIILVVGTKGSIIAWKMSLHFFTVSGVNATVFDPVTAVVGIVASFVGGAVIGALFAWIWNRVSWYTY